MAVLRVRASEASAPEGSATRLHWFRAPRWFLSCTLRLPACRMLALIFAAAAFLTSASQARAQSEPPTEYQVKAAFLYNFAKFVEWPADAFPDVQSPIVLGILGDDPFGSVLDKMIYGKAANGRGFVVKRVSEDAKLRSCHILFISSSEKKHLARILEGLKGAGVLTVGDMDRFAESGGVIHLLLAENKVRFGINLTAAARARLKISSKLLALARIVADEQRMGKN